MATYEEALAVQEEFEKVYLNTPTHRACNATTAISRDDETGSFTLEVSLSQHLAINAAQPIFIANIPIRYTIAG